MDKKQRGMIVKTTVRMLLSLILVLFIYCVPPFNPLVIIAMILCTSYVVGMWIGLFFQTSFAVIAMIYTISILGLASYGILDVVNGVLIHVLLAMIILLMKKKTSIEST